MRLVSENSEAELARHTAEGQVKWKIRELAADLLRIIRGAGKPYEIMRQMVELSEACSRVAWLAEPARSTNWLPSGDFTGPM